MKKGIVLLIGILLLIPSAGLAAKKKEKQAEPLSVAESPREMRIQEQGMKEAGSKEAGQRKKKKKPSKKKAASLEEDKEDSNKLEEAGRSRTAK